MAEVILTAEGADDWSYRGEGAANLVLAYTGSSSAFVGKVLRLKKACRGGGNEVGEGGREPALSAHECLLWKDVVDLAAEEPMSKDNVHRLFALHVMAPLLGSDHVDAGINIQVTREFLSSVEKNVTNQGPGWRVHAAKINTLCDSALLISDHSVFPHDIRSKQLCIAIELKPKCGFLLCSEFITKRNVVKTHVSRFKMHQALKLHQGEILQMSDYDPCDLFSGSQGRINKAIGALFATPQNNLRIFLNGSLIFGALGGGMETMEKSDSVVDQTYERNKTFRDSIKGVIQADSIVRIARLQELVAEAIFRSRVLDPLLEAQKLDAIDIEGAIHAYYNIISKPCLVCNAMTVAEFSRESSILHSLTSEESLKIVKNYLIAATAKDCSLMISFRPRSTRDETSEHSSIFLESTNQTFDYKVSFIDLDMKSFKKMVYYYEIDGRIASFYSKTRNNGTDNNSMNVMNGYSGTIPIPQD